MSKKGSNKLEEIEIQPEKMNITKEQAILIANSNTCLKDSVFF